ncbi:type I toxin-antitoxin system Ibs family toxin, partial [Escherichia coli]
RLVIILIVLLLISFGAY